MSISATCPIENKNEQKELEDMEKLLNICNSKIIHITEWKSKHTYERVIRSMMTKFGDLELEISAIIDGRIEKCFLDAAAELKRDGKYLFEKKAKVNATIRELGEKVVKAITESYKTFFRRINSISNEELRKHVQILRSDIQNVPFLGFDESSDKIWCTDVNISFSDADFAKFLHGNKVEVESIHTVGSNASSSDDSYVHSNVYTPKRYGFNTGDVLIVIGAVALGIPLIVVAGVVSISIGVPVDGIGLPISGIIKVCRFLSLPVLSLSSILLGRSCYIVDCFIYRLICTFIACRR